MGSRTFGCCLVEVETLRIHILKRGYFETGDGKISMLTCLVAYAGKFRTRVRIKNEGEIQL